MQPEAPRLGGQHDDPEDRLLREIKELLAQLLGAVQSGTAITVNLVVSGSVNLNVITPPPPVLPATHAVLTISQGANMAGAITVDTTNETATLAFLDDKGDVAATPAGAIVTFTSDNEAVATVAADAANPLQGDVSPVSIGDANIGATVADASGNPILEPDGVTPFSVAPVAISVSAGAADALVLTLSV